MYFATPINIGLPVILCGTLIKVLSFILTKVSDCGKLIVVTWPLSFFVSTILQVIWPSPGTLVNMFQKTE